jgi:hypothetical protein
MPTRHAAFDAIRDLPEAALRDLLVSDEPVERVWAAWALGLRLGAGSASTLRLAAGNDPDAGARRHLVVLLAGFGERDAVAALAMGDPDAHVRATASQYVMRLAGAQPALWSLVRARLGDAEAVVREALVLHLTANAPLEVRDAAIRCISDAAPAVREAVIGQLDVLHGAQGPLPEAVKGWVMQEPLADLRRLLFAAWRARDGGASLVAEAARTQRQDLALEALDRVAADEPSVPWATVAALAETGSDKVRQRVFSLFTTRMDEVPLGWLLRHFAGHRWAASYGTQLLPRLARVHSLVPDERAALAAIAHAATEELSRSRDYWDDEEYGDWEEWRSKLEALVIEAGRLYGDRRS